MVKLIPVNYYGLCYPHGITAPLSEVAGHFGKCTVATQLPFSLHTEYSAAPRRLSKLAMEYPSIRQSVREGVPLLWTPPGLACALHLTFPSFCRPMGFWCKRRNLSRF